MYNRPNLSDEDLARRIPHVMGTQHPDNVSKVPFGPTARVGRELESDEVLYNISTLGLGEIMIDYERKHGECTPLWDWLHRCPTCLEERVIGRDFHVTPRLPNPDTDRDDPYFWQGLGVFTHSVLSMGHLGSDRPAFTEFIVPDASNGATLARIERHLSDRFEVLKEEYQAYGDGTTLDYGGDYFVQGIPLIETVEDLLAPERIWDDLVRTRKELSGRDTHVQRSFIARSDPALKAGMLPALLAATVALDRGRAYEVRTGIRVPQLVGIGSAPFRGGLTPDPGAVERVLATYPGAMTLTVQSAFRYDHPEAEVRKAIETLETALHRGWIDRAQEGFGLDLDEIEAVCRVVVVLKKAYEASFAEFAPWVGRVAEIIPRHRERYARSDLTGDDRRVGGLPAVRAIRFAASCYTLGIPPGILGLRALDSLDDDQRALIDRVCPTAKAWVVEELRWATSKGTNQLGGLRLVDHDLAAARAWAGTVEPQPEHDEITDRVPPALDAGDDLLPLVLAAARIRRFLG